MVPRRFLCVKHGDQIFKVAGIAHRRWGWHGEGEAFERWKKARLIHHPPRANAAALAVRCGPAPCAGGGARLGLMGRCAAGRDRAAAG